MELQFAKERVFDMATEAQPLLNEHYEEITLHKDVMKLNPDWIKYAVLEERGELHCFSVRHEGTLVGYAVFFLTPHIHYKDSLVATNDIIYFLPQYRRGLTPVKFIKYCEAEMKKKGAVKLVFHVKLAHDWSPILSRLGYDPEEVMHGKVL